MTQPSTNDVAVEPAADTLYQAQTTATAVAQLSAAQELDLAAAYRIQRTVADLRMNSGERSTGFKMGFTSRAKMRQMGVDEVIGGLLTSSMAWADGDVIDPDRLIHPRIEPELVFRLGRDLHPDDSAESAVSAVDAVAAGLEVIDSRYANFKFSLTDVVADNASAAGYAVGRWCPPSADLANRGVLLEVDGAVAQTGSTAAILGDPWRAFAAAVRLSRQVGASLRAGDIVLAGAATEAVAFVRGSTVRATVSGLGSVTLSLGGGAR